MSLVVFKVVLIGDSGVGKTSVLSRFLGEQFNPTFISTVTGETIKKKRMNVQGHQVELQLWDAPGGENFRTVSASYMKDAKCVIVCFDVSKDGSFRNIDNWMEILDHAENTTYSPSKIIIGNKTDKTRCVRSEEAEHKAEQLYSVYHETSAREDSLEHFNKIFQQIVIELLEKSQLSNSGSLVSSANVSPDDHHWYNKCILI